MEEKKFYCPECGEDVTEMVKAAIISHVRSQAASKKRRTTEKTIERNRKSAERLKQWQQENREKVAEHAKQASAARTTASFKKQGETIRETNRRKSVLFAQLLMEHIQNGGVVTPEVEERLMGDAREKIGKTKKENS